MTSEHQEITWEDTHGHVDLDDAYSVCSGVPGDPEGIQEWCLSDSLAKAEAAFEAIKDRTELGLITLRDRYAGTTLMRVDHRRA